MGDKSKIEWTDATWNPVTGCTKVSQGCKNCYAETLAGRLWTYQYPPNADGSPRKFTDIRIHPKRLELPLHWKQPRRIFVNSVSDLFHEAVPELFIYKVFSVMARAHWHTFQVLTKRADRMLDICSRLSLITPNELKHLTEPDVTLAPSRLRMNEIRPIPNIWLGVSCEDQKMAEERIPILLETPAATKFISCEPLLEPIDLSRITIHSGSVSGSRLSWVICGGESGPKARPMHPDWARSLRDQCARVGVPFFFKQWGEWLPVAAQYSEDDLIWKLDPDAHSICLGNRGTLYSEYRNGKEEYWCGYQPDPGQNPWFLEAVGKKTSGRLLDGHQWNEFPN